MQVAREREMMKMEWKQLSQLIDRFVGIIMFIAAVLTGIVSHSHEH